MIRFEGRGGTLSLAIEADVTDDDCLEALATYIVREEPELYGLVTELMSRNRLEPYRRDVVLMIDDGELVVDDSISDHANARITIVDLPVAYVSKTRRGLVSRVSETSALDETRETLLRAPELTD